MALGVTCRQDCWPVRERLFFLGGEPSPAGPHLPNIARMGSNVKILGLDLYQQGQVWAGAVPAGEAPTVSVTPSFQRVERSWT